MPEKPVDAELRRLCEVAVAGLDGNLDALSEPSLEFLARALGTEDPLKTLGYCSVMAKADDGLQGENYEGGYNGDGTFSFSLRGVEVDDDGNEEDASEELITLTEAELRKIASGERTSVDFQYD